MTVKRTTIDNKNHCIGTFTKQQQAFITEGALHHDDMIERMKLAFGIKKTKVKGKRHTYFYSPPGIGKTHTAQELIDTASCQVMKIQGVTTVSHMTAQLAYYAYMVLMQDKSDKRTTPSTFTVWIDDCDSLFTDANNLNLMKGALDEKRNVWSYSKNLSLQIATYRNSGMANLNLIADALEYFQVEGSLGVEIPTHNIRFIITSNKSLAAPNDAKTQGGNKRATLEAPLHDRVEYIDLGKNLDAQVLWGWVAHLALPLDLHGLTMAKKKELLVWMFDNWSRLSNNSMRAVLQHAATMVNYPKDYLRRMNSTLNK